ncbi:MAG: hypothetical protein MUC38_10795 [Cyclobacteriaceae bacterium]|jgi:hypothetical protein|nr:hypothetical protein [Cyclobacteriaceae bacterium]
MARVKIEVANALRNAARKLEASPKYQWGHMGACNCGFLAQEITHLTQAEIHRRALHRYGDWNEQLNDYCPANGLPFDEVISELIAFGFDSEDLKNLERLGDPKVLATLSQHERNLRHNVKADVVKYMNTWAAMIEAELAQKIELPSLERPIPVL